MINILNKYLSQNGEEKFINLKDSFIFVYHSLMWLGF